MVGAGSSRRSDSATVSARCSGSLGTSSFRLLRKDVCVVCPALILAAWKPDRGSGLAALQLGDHGARMSPMPDATGYLASHATKCGRGAGTGGRVRSEGTMSASRRCT